MNDVQSGFEKSREIVNAYRNGMAEKIIGQKKLIDGILMAVIAGGHVLLEGVPGLAKTLAVKTFAELSSLSFKRIQFTPDLLPADLIGTLIFDPAKRDFSVRKGPVFANLILADEINRAPAKVQSALLEAMAEHQITIGENSYPLPEPFFVLATQNPIEQEGTYTLPEAELDRFLLKLVVPYPLMNEEASIVRITNGLQSPESPAERKSGRTAVISTHDIIQIREDIQSVHCDDALVSYIVSLVAATRPLAETRRDRHLRDDYLKYISFGASPRASIALCQCARINAFFEGRNFVLPEDIKAVALPVLRHRLVLSYEAGADNLSADEIISGILEIIPLP
ncbi:MoxR family ATPase [Brucepastera parasyntrophica]|uniref:AAA family ATPase n=1 Tax=Brucepastera parasyntrophica TaxID=2880008 RepID=UPI00210E2AA9|nr:MoxR family ATPase [Brucepastera parasyntrophica]ULQ60705.1 MoxR family ATPase [Brucepastera parasyntrophica]